MLKRGNWMMVQKKRTKGVYIKDIAAALGVHPKTVRRAWSRGSALPGKGPRARRPREIRCYFADWRLLCTLLGPC